MGEQLSLHNPCCTDRPPIYVYLIHIWTVFCPDFQKGMMPSEKGTFSAVNRQKGKISAVNWRKRAQLAQWTEYQKKATLCVDNKKAKTELKAMCDCH